MKLEDVRLIVIHASATRPRVDIDASTIRRWHMEERGWSDIGYHYVIRLNGVIETGRSLTRMGAHVKGHNRNSIGICLIGGYGGAATDAFEDHFRLEQRTSLIELLHKVLHDIGDCTEVRIAGHNEFANKGCPCFSVPLWLKENGLDPRT